jgi:hypothetical protein
MNSISNGKFPDSSNEIKWRPIVDAFWLGGIFNSCFGSRWFEKSLTVAEWTEVGGSQIWERRRMVSIMLSPPGGSCKFLTLDASHIVSSHAIL